MAILTQGANPASRHPSPGIAQTLGPTIQAVIGNIQRGQQQQQQLEHGQVLERLLSSAQQQGPNDGMGMLNALLQARSQGVPQEQIQPYLEAIPKYQEQQARQQQQSQIKPDAIAQKWAYGELGKEKSIKALEHSIEELRQENAKGFTGPLSGYVPQAFANKEAAATRRKIDIDAVQLLNTHKSMFPRGITQGEFQSLSDKLVSSKNKPEVNAAILDAYEGLAKIQRAELEAVKQAISQYGYVSNLPLLASQIADEMEPAKREIYDNMKRVIDQAAATPYQKSKSPSPTQGPSEMKRQDLGRTQQEPMIRFKHKKTGRTGSIPRSEYFPHEDIEIVSEGPAT